MLPRQGPGPEVRGCRTALGGPRGRDGVSGPSTHPLAVEALVRALEAERIGVLAADAAALRIQRLKERFLLPFALPDPKAARLAAGVGESRALAERIAQESGIPTVA